MTVPRLFSGKRLKAARSVKRRRRTSIDDGERYCARFSRENVDGFPGGPGTRRHFGLTAVPDFAARVYTPVASAAGLWGPAPLYTFMYRLAERREVVGRRRYILHRRAIRYLVRSLTVGDPTQ